MSRHFGLSSRPASSGAQRLQAGSPSIGRYAPSNSNLLSADPPFERSQFTQALIDILAVTFGIFFLCSVACSLPLAIFIMFFVN